MEVSEGHGAGPDRLHLPQLPLPLLLLLYTLWISQQHMRAEAVLPLLLHHLQTVLEVLPAPSHQRVFTQKLPRGFVDEQGETLLPGRRIDKDARDVEATVAIVEGNIFGADILFDICHRDGAHRELHSRLSVFFIGPDHSVCHEVACAPTPWDTWSLRRPVNEPVSDRSQTQGRKMSLEEKLWVCHLQETGGALQQQAPPH